MRTIGTRSYQSGFGNTFATEAIEHTLPAQGNSPQNAAHGLYAEQLSGSAFTAPRASNLRTWLYRIRPSAVHPPFVLHTHSTFIGAPFNPMPTAPNQLRWNPSPIPKKQTDLIEGIVTMAGGGQAANWAGLAVHTYAANRSMDKRYFYNADGEMLFVPWAGGLVFRTEMGVLEIAPGEIAVIPRGIKFAVDLTDSTASGYICENYGAPFTLPELGPIGANGLAFPRHFLYPVASYEDIENTCELLVKSDGALWRTSLDHSPLDVVGWQGNYAPYKYDLKNFMAINTVSFDHPDPSIFTVLTSPSNTPGVANVDFVIFPPRWLVAEDTFRPPYFHRNVMSEFMGLITGAYDAKEGGGFSPGGASLHNCMSAHGPDAASFEKSAQAEQNPVYLKDTMAFMFESRFLLHPTPYALNHDLQDDYYKCWQGLKRNFFPPEKS
jgi:homogentisate 1,2-dioxygenase